MYTSIEPEYGKDQFFSITWESTLKCNLDCRYCSSHDNSIPHPSLAECLQTIDFLYEYVNTYMQVKNEKQQHVSFNIFGGESLFHPNIHEILAYAISKHQINKYDWTLGLSTITNAIVKPKVWNSIIDYFSYYTVSYHSESNQDEQHLFKQNVSLLRDLNKNYHVAILMNPLAWDNCIEMIEWCKTNNIKHLIRQLDDNTKEAKFAYTNSQADWFYTHRGIEKPITFLKKGEKVNLNNQGRSCCGGQQLNVNKDYTCNTTYIPNNNFTDWYCSVNYFFVFVKQTTKEVFTNKDCKMSYDGIYGPIGTLDNCDLIIQDLKNRLSNNRLLPIICKKERCWCGLCSPKANTINEFSDIMIKYLKE